MCGKKRVLTAVMLSWLALVVVVSPAFASLGVGTDTGKIEIPQPLVAGGSYPLAQFGIFNAGDTAYGYRMQVAPSNRKAMAAPGTWFTFSPDAFFLNPQQSHVVHTVLKVSLDATPGVYSVQLQGTPKLPKSTTPGGHLNVGAGPILTFTVAQPNWWQHIYYLFLAQMPWSGIAGIVIVVMIVLWIWLAVRRALRRSALSTVEQPRAELAESEQIESDVPAPSTEQDE